MPEVNANQPPMLMRRHPEYSRMAPKWDFWLDSYMAPLDEYAKLYLFKNEKEGVEEYAERCKRAYRENHSKRVVDLINTYLFKEEATRNTENELLRGFFKDADGRGKSLTQFMKSVSLFSSIAGRVYIVVDRKEPAELTGTHADTVNSSVYCYMLLPQDVLDISFDDYGVVRWALVQEHVRDDEDPFTSSGEMKKRFRLWTKDEWFVWDSGDENFTASGRTGLGMVPIIPVNNEESVSDYYAPSLISDVSYLDRAIFNNYSRLDVIVNEQTFSQLIFPIEAALTSSVVDDAKLRSEMMTLAANRILFYSASSEAKPAYISPDASQAEFILSMLQHQTKQLYASIGLQNEASSEAKDYKSGLSKSYDFDKLNKLLASKADNLEQAEAEIFKIFKKWKAIEDVEIEVDYPEEFDVKTLAQEIMLAQELSLLDISQKFIKEVFKKVVAKALPKATKEVLDEINKEIDEKDYSAEAIQQNVFDFDNLNSGEDDVHEKKAQGKVGGRLKQEQTKFDQAH